MCRLGMITMADESSVMRRLVTNQLMLLSNLEMQNDGAGITDGLSVRKSARPLSLIHISEPTRRHHVSRMPSSA